jgi:hypothetical protein
MKEENLMVGRRKLCFVVAPLVMGSTLLLACTLVTTGPPTSPQDAGPTLSYDGGADDGSANADDGGASMADGGASVGDGGAGVDEGGSCAFVDIHWGSGLEPCPGSSGGLCTSGYDFGSNGCFASNVCATDGTNTNCNDVSGQWTQTGCGTVTVVKCDGTSFTVNVRGPGADGKLTIDGHPYDAVSPLSHPLSCSCADAGLDGGSPQTNNFLGAPWSGTEAVSFVCGDGGAFSGNQALSGVSFQPTVSGIRTTDKTGCVYDFAVSGDTATLVAPVVCTIRTDAGIQTQRITSATLTSSDGHHMTGELRGTDAEGALYCTFDNSLTLSR